MLRISVIGGVVALGIAQVARATTFGQYVPGTYVPGALDIYHQQYNTPQVVNSVPGGLTGVDSIYQGVVSVFNPVYDTDQIVALGLGGSITLQFPHPVAPNYQLGVFSNAGLTDLASFTGSVDGYFPDQLPPGEAGTFGGGLVDVRVSKDDVNWVDLGLKNINIPENYYQNAGPFDFAAPDSPVVADFGKPFLGTLDSFDDQMYPQIVTTLNGSAGGTWLDLSGSGLSQINYVQFYEDPNLLPAGSQFALQAVAVSESAVPEPASAMGLVFLGGLLLRRKARN